jgi:hypothetical protein
MAKTTKKTYRITNWAQYNNSLVERGNITFWFSDEAIQQWEHQNQQKKRGRPFVYSDTAIETLLILRELFRLPYRQTEGLGKSLVKLMQIDVRIPDFTSLAKRAANIRCSLLPKKRSRTIDVVVDSTGLKVYGEGEWKTRTHGKSKRRTWRKLHLAVNPETQEIVAELLTENSVHDSQAVDDLLNQIDSDVNVRKFSGDGGYDTWHVHTTLKTRNITAIIPPQKNAKIRQHGNSSEEPLARDQAIREIRKKGRKRWKQEIGYHRRSLAETAMYRIKNPFGEKLKNRILRNQKTEARLRSKILNRFTQIGMPDSVWD